MGGGTTWGLGVQAPVVAADSEAGSCQLLTQEALSAVSVLLREAAGGMEDVGESNH